MKEKQDRKRTMKKKSENLENRNRKARRLGSLERCINCRREKTKKASKKKLVTGYYRFYDSSEATIDDSV